MLQKKQTTAASANLGGAMESGNHSKNGASLKSLMSKGKLWGIAAILLFTAFMGACKKDKIEEIPLSVPTNVKAAPTDEGIKVSWNAVQGAVYYEIDITSDRGVENKNVYDVFTLYKPTKSGNYSFKVRAVRGSEYSAWCTAVSVAYTDPNALTVPTRLTAIQVKDSIYVSWDTVRVADKYTLFVSDDKDWNKEYSCKTPGMKLYDLTHGVKYTLKVKAHKGNEATDWSDTVSCVYNDPYVLTVPTRLTAKQVRDSIKVSWDSVKNADRYRLYVYNYYTGTNYYYCKNVDTIFYDLTDGRTYTFKVQAYKGSKYSDWTSEVYCTYRDSILLTGPVGLSVSQANQSLRVSWNEVKGASKYELRVYKDGSFVSDYNCYVPYYVYSGPTDGSRYTFSVRVYRNSSTYSQWSNSVSYTYSASGGGTQSGLYTGIIGFNNELKEKSISLLTNYETIDNTYDFTSFVDKLKQKDGTGLYYGVDNAISRLEVAKYPQDLDQIWMITFIDGLDNVSIDKNTSYNRRDDYRDAVKKRITETKIKGKSITAYSIGLKGNDVRDDNAFLAGLKAVASADSNVKNVTDMNAVNQTFKDIANSLYVKNATQTLNLKMTSGYNDGTKIRFTFDDVEDAADSKVYIEGTYRRGTTRTLQDVKYVKVKSSSGTTITGSLSGFFITFSFENCSIDTTGISLTNVKQWEYLSAQVQWLKNLEFNGNKDVETEITRKSAVIMLVLDCTTSLGTDFEKMKVAAKEFIQILTRK